jgi:hypothetical protein
VTSTPTKPGVEAAAHQLLLDAGFRAFQLADGRTEYGRVSGMFVLRLRHDHQAGTVELDLGMIGRDNDGTNTVAWRPWSTPFGEGIWQAATEVTAFAALVEHGIGPGD